MSEEKTANEIVDEAFELLQFTSPQPPEAEAWLKAANMALRDQLKPGAMWAFASDVLALMHTGQIKFQMVSHFDPPPKRQQISYLAFNGGEVSTERVTRPDIDPIHKAIRKIK